MRTRSLDHGQTTNHVEIRFAYVVYPKFIHTLIGSEPAGAGLPYLPDHDSTLFGFSPNIGHKTLEGVARESNQYCRIKPELSSCILPKRVARRSNSILRRCRCRPPSMNLSISAGEIMYCTADRHMRCMFLVSFS